MKTGKKVVDAYQLANRIIEKSGVSNPESLPDMERFQIVMRHIMHQPKPKAKGK